ncbi:MAG: BREX-1 system adenine-specific DNA-methyltransferase PglX [Methylococcaceae bacterium]
MLNPETITVIDPACGSGHILVEAYDVLKAIYLERGYQLRSIPRLILEKNLYGLDIDDRAAQLAGFALLMKARADDRRLFDELPKLNVYSLQSSKNLNLPLLWRQLDLNGQSKIGTTSSLFDEPQTDLIQVIDDSNYQLIKNTVALFEQAKTLGSLIQVPAEHAQPLKDLLAQLQALTTGGNNFQKIAATTLIPFIRQAVILGMQFDAVVANPPYMGGKYLNPLLKNHLKENYKGFEKDFFSAFMIRNLELTKKTGQLGFMTPFVWMFISSYENLRNRFIDSATITSLIQPELHAFFDSAFVSICCFTVSATHLNNYEGSFIRLTDFYGADLQPEKTLEAIKNPDCGWFYNAKPDDFKKIPGSPVAYWMSEKMRVALDSPKRISDETISDGQTKTGNNAKYLRQAWEVSNSDVGLGKKWLYHPKGGEYRKWYGNRDWLIDWSETARVHYRSDFVARILPEYLWGKKGVCWTLITSGDNSFRIVSEDEIFNLAAPTLFPNNELWLNSMLAFLNTSLAGIMLKFLNPTLNTNVGEIQSLPFPYHKENLINTAALCASLCVEIAKNDWNNYEISGDFTENPLIRQKHNTPVAPVIPAGMPESSHRDVNLSAYTPAYSGIGVNINLPSVALDSGIPAGMTAFEDNAANPNNVGWVSDSVTQHTEVTDVGLRDKAANPTYASTSLEQCFNRWQTQNRAAIVEMQRLEEENNRLFIDAYGLQDELSSEVPESQITLARADREKDCQRLISYAIGCMMGRYRLDRPGLIYAHAGNVDFDKIYYGTDTPPFEKGGPGGILPITESENQEQNQEQIPPNPPFAKGGIFAPDADGIVPITDELWFEDDAANRLNEFLLAVWGNPSPQPSPQGEGVEANIAWLAESLGQKGNETPQETIRRYIAGSFYKNHLQTYKKRPIYWLFSSGKQAAFQALVYLHRYNESTLSRMRAEYVVPLTGKIQSRIEMLKKDADAATSNAAKSKLDKDIDKLKKKYVELLSFDEKLRHYADLRIPLDLDDGVKVNYGKFGDLLAEVKAVAGGKDE